MNIKILVATHKPYWMPNDDAYLPLHVGKNGKNSIGFIGDDSGDHISARNSNYCELTGMYWGWKNLRCEYIGICHYRRYLGYVPVSENLSDKQTAIFKTSDYDKFLKKYDVILPKKRNYYIETVRSQYEHAHNKSDLDEVERVIAELYPEYSSAFNIVMGRRSLHILNMCVMRKELFDQYCSWLFNILFTVEKRIDIEHYNTYEARVFGFLSERLFNVWLEKQELKIKEAEVINLETVNWIKKVLDFVKRKFLGK